MSGHTPAPWRQRNGTSTVVIADAIHVRLDGTSMPIHYEIAYAKSAKGGLSERIANARLIAAAPDLLRAANEALQWLEAVNFGGVTNEPRLERIRAAIAKATPIQKEAGQ